MAHMNRGNEPEFDSEHQDHPEADGVFLKNPTVRKLMHAVQVWWRHHPAKLALEIAQPSLHQYAQRKPYHLLGIAAAVGVATVFVRPWRLVSVTGLALAAVKSSGIANMAMSILLSRLKRQGSEKQMNP